MQRLSCGSGGDRSFRAGGRVIGGDLRWGARCHPRGDPMRPAGKGRGGAGGMAVSHPGRREGPGCPGRGRCWAWEAVQALQGGEAGRARLWLCTVSLTLLCRVRPQAQPQAPQPLKGVLTHWAGRELRPPPEAGPAPASPRLALPADLCPQEGGCSPSRGGPARTLPHVPLGHVSRSRAGSLPG